MPSYFFIGLQFTLMKRKKEKEQLDINFKIPELICVFVEKDLPN